MRFKRYFDSKERTQMEGVWKEVYNVFIDLRVLGKSVIKNDSSVCVRNTLLSYAEKEFLNLKRNGFGELLDLINVYLPILSGVYGEICVKFSGYVKFFAKLFAELCGDKHTFFCIK